MHCRYCIRERYLFDSFWVENAWKEIDSRKLFHTNTSLWIKRPLKTLRFINTLCSRKTFLVSRKIHACMFNIACTI